MSAVNALIYPTVVALMTDAAVSQDGKLMSVHSKVHRFPHLDAALACTAAMPGISWIIDTFVGGCSVSFDDLTDTLPLAVEIGLRELDREGVARGAFDILAVGWSDREGRFVGRALSYEPGGKPTMHDNVGALYLQPYDPVIAQRLDAAGLSPERLLRMESQIAAERLMEVMEVQRSRGAATGHLVGGFQEATVLCRDLAQTRIVQRWPDKVHPDFIVDG